MPVLISRSMIGAKLTTLYSKFEQFEAVIIAQAMPQEGAE
jgi:hypothetical protein